MLFYRECWQGQVLAIYLVYASGKPRGASSLVAARTRFARCQAMYGILVLYVLDILVSHTRSDPVDLLFFVPSLKVDDIMHAVKAAYPEVRLGIHCHNDQGLAVANSLQAVRSGADVVQVNTKDAE